MEPPPVANSAAPPFFVEFLRKYRDSPSLWNSQGAEYHNKFAKDESINKLIEVCKKHNLRDSSRAFVLRKIYTTRLAFRKELKKLEKLKANNGKRTRHRALWYFKHMEFLKDLELANLGFSWPQRTVSEPPAFDMVRVFDGCSFRNDGRAKKGSTWSCLHQNCEARILLDAKGQIAKGLIREHNHPAGKMDPLELEYVECDVDVDSMFTTEEHDTKANITPQITGDSVCSEVVVETSAQPHRLKKRKICVEGEEDEDDDRMEPLVRVKAEPTFESSPSYLSAPTKDECDIYGQLIAAKLKKMDDRTRDIAMNKIDNVLFQLKMNPTKDI